jgi:aminopeptidase YwaD
MVKLFLAVIIIIISLPISAQDKSIDNLRKHVTILSSDSLLGRGAGDSGIIMARDYILNEFKNIGLSPYKGKYEYPFSFKIGPARVQSKNLISVIESSDSVYKNEYIVLGAHYDHLGWDIVKNKKVIYNGADDNASGVSAMLEIARKLILNKQSLKRGIIIIAFDAEETGLNGSQSIFSDSVFNNINIKCMFSLDMIGTYEKNKGIVLTGFKNIKDYDLILNETNKEPVIRITQINTTLENGTDTKPFGDNGIPAIHVFTGTNSPYHKPEDDSNLIDYNGMDSIVTFMYSLTNNLANRPELILDPSYTKKSNKAVRVVAGIRLGVGQSHYMYIHSFFNGKPVAAFNIGLYSQIKLGKHFAIQPEVLYSNSGSNTSIGSVRTQAITIPTHILFGTNNKNKGNTYLMFGGYYRYVTAVTANGKNLSNFGDFEKVQLGLSYGIGLDVMKIQVSLLAQDALTNGLKKNGNIREKSIYLNFGYKF